jgi:hypothetical protein
MSEYWLDSFHQLKIYSAVNGTCQIPKSATEDEKRLKSWVRIQQQNRDKLSDERLALLESLAGWQWE